MLLRGHVRSKGEPGWAASGEYILDFSGAEGNGKKDTPEVWHQVTDFYNVLPIEIVRIGVEVPYIGCEEEGNATVQVV